MNTRPAGNLVALAVLAALAAVVAVAAQTGTPARGTTPTTVLHPVGDGGIHGAVSLVPTPITATTSAALTIHGLPARARVEARLHTGSSLDRLSADSTALPGGIANEGGSFRAYGRVVSRNGRELRITDVTDGTHTILVYADDGLVAYAHIPHA